ncbi:MAG: EF-hand domain-containing protein [Planctomycetes bacterium]|nr:EF-hand domain-containing protein [Planctomycetota bacterium]
MNGRVRALAGAAIVAAAVALAGSRAGGDPPGAAPAGPADDPEAVRDVFLLLDRGPLHLRLRITIGGKSPQAVRREYLARLFKALDTDGDGKLTRAEFERSPLNTSRRGPSARPLSPKEAAEVVPAAKLTGALERVVGETRAFRQDNTARKTDDMVFAALDTNKDGVLSEDEIRAAQELLLAKDQDEDDCLTIEEFNPPEVLMPVAVFPGAPERPLAAVSTLLVDGTGPLFGPRLIRRYDRNGDGKLSREEIGLSPERFRALDTDGDGKLGAEELKAFHKQPPDVGAGIELQPPAGQAPRIALAAGSSARTTRPDVAVFGLGESDLALAVRSFDPVTAAVADARQQFNRLDADQNGYLDRDELKENVRFQRGLFEAIDADGDDKIFWAEMESYVRSRAEAAATRCDVVLHDLGHGFFEALDRNHDGRIGLREIRAAADTLRGLRKPGLTVLRATDPPRRMHLEVVRGTFQLFSTGPAGESTVPKLAAAPRTPVGPIWFQRMDRNMDGDLTWKEFLGPRHVFEELDTNHDGLISPEEAEKAIEKFK